MKKIKYIFIILITCIGFISCSDVNSVHDKYLVDGEDLLVGKLDTIRYYGGDQRARIVVWAGDFRATKFIISRADTTLSYNFKLSDTNRKDSMVFFVNNLREGTNVLQFVTWNADSTVHSIGTTKTIITWGNKYRSLLTNRTVVSSKFNLLTKAYTLTWAPNNVVEPTYGKPAIGHEIKYMNTDGEEKMIRDIYTNPIMPTATTPLVKYPTVNGSYSYRMIYLPDVSCIDTFRTAYTTVVTP